MDMGPGQRPPSFGAGSTHNVDSLKMRKKLPVLDFGTSRLEAFSPTFIRRTFEQWVVEIV
eukprot:12138498-Prorocentrum_lima.AAC.1